jgi:hypothetical protein
MGQGVLPEDEAAAGRKPLRHVSSDEEDDDDDDDDLYYDEATDQVYNSRGKVVDPSRLLGGSRKAGGQGDGRDGAHGSRGKYQRGSKEEEESAPGRVGRNFVVGKGELPPEEEKIDWNAEIERRKQRLRKVSTDTTGTSKIPIFPILLPLLLSSYF